MTKEERNEYQRKWYAENKEKVKEYVKKWDAENKEKRKEQSKKWRAENKEKRKEIDKKWYAENKEKRNEHVKKWYAGNIKNITDYYCIRRILKDFPHLTTAEIKQHPELIELKRLSIINTRINKQEKHGN